MHPTQTQHTNLSHTLVPHTSARETNFRMDAKSSLTPWFIREKLILIRGICVRKKREVVEILSSDARNI